MKSLVADALRRSFNLTSLRDEIIRTGDDILREIEIRQLAMVVGKADWTHGQRLAEARRALDLADQVGTADGQAMLNVATSDCVAAYRRAVVEMAARGEPLPQAADEVRNIREAQLWRADAAARQS